MIGLSLLFCACVDKSNSGGNAEDGGQGRIGNAASVDHGSDSSVQDGNNPCSPELNPCMDSNGSEESSGNPRDIPPAGGTRRVRGMVHVSGSAVFFTPCGTQTELSINDDATASLARVAPDLAGPDGLYYAIMDVSGTDAALSLLRLWHATPLDESAGCDEELADVIYKAGGNEPFWSITVFSDGRLTLSRPDSGVQNFSVASLSDDGNFVNITGTAPEGGQEITMEFSRGDCYDDMSGAYSSMLASVLYGEEKYGGCAWVGEASGLVGGE